MDKERIAAKLTKMGYKAVLEDGVIMCAASNRKDAREVENVLMGLSYHGSWGCRISDGEGKAKRKENLLGDESESVSGIKQYCRYCSFCCYGDIPYCTHFDKELSDSGIRKQNHCEAFDLSPLGDVESGRQYQPREHRKKDCDGQMSIMDLLG